MLQIRNLSVPPAKCCKSPSRPSTTFIPITNAKYCHNISSIHHLNQKFAKTQKPEDALVVAIETQNKRGNRFPFPWNAGNWSRPWRIQIEFRRRRRRRECASPSWMMIRRRKRRFPPIRARGADAMPWAWSRNGGRLPLPAKTGSNPMRVPQLSYRHGNNKNSSLVS